MKGLNRSPLSFLCPDELMMDVPARWRALLMQGEKRKIKVADKQMHAVSPVSLPRADVPLSQDVWPMTFLV